MPNELYTKISFYIVAHADDWQLFMQPNAHKDLVAPASKVVYIITTAGDAGKDERYWKAREEGTKSSIRFCLAPLELLCESGGVKTLYSHKLSYWSCNNATCYFLRLPDGNLDGSGFSAYNYQSLTKFKNEKINSITAIDNSTTYNSWSNFYNSLETIIITESAGISNTFINYLNPCINLNPDDHADHVATGQAVQCTGVISKLPQALFTGYNLRNHPERLDATDYFWKAAMLAAYEKAVFDDSGYSTLRESIDTYLDWCSKSASFHTLNE